MTEKEEQAYMMGEAAAYRRMLNEALRMLGESDPEVCKARWMSERAETIALLRTLCLDHGDNGWDDSLHLTDVIEKHLWRHVEPLLPDPEDTPA